MLSSNDFKIKGTDNTASKEFSKFIDLLRMVNRQPPKKDKKDESEKDKLLKSLSDEVNRLKNGKSNVDYTNILTTISRDVEIIGYDSLLELQNILTTLNTIYDNGLKVTSDQIFDVKVVSDNGNHKEDSIFSDFINIPFSDTSDIFSSDSHQGLVNDLLSATTNDHVSEELELASSALPEVASSALPEVASSALPEVASSALTEVAGDLLPEIAGVASDALPMIAGSVGSILSITGAIAKGVRSATKALDESINLYQENYGIIDARLQTLDSKVSGSIVNGLTRFLTSMVDYDFAGQEGQKSLASINNTLIAALGQNSYISYKTILSNVDTLTKKGIVFNVEDRAFLASITDRIVESFDLGNETLLRLIRLQQEDSSRIMLGMEANLTQVLNSFFEDSSYIAQNVFETVTSNLIDSISTKNTADSQEYQYSVQKWLGSLYSVGLSENTVSSLTEAINYLGSGQVDKFLSNDMSTLFNMAIAQSGYSLSDILTQGLTSSAVNDIFKTIIQIISDIRSNTKDQVTRSAFSDVFGVPVADMLAIVNLKNDVESLVDINKQQAELEADFNNQLLFLQTRTSLYQKYSNVKDNMLYSIGATIGSNPSEYLEYLVGTTLIDLGTILGGTFGDVVATTGLTPVLDSIGDAMLDVNLKSMLGTNSAIAPIAKVGDVIGDLLANVFGLGFQKSVVDISANASLMLVDAALHTSAKRLINNELSGLAKSIISRGDTENNIIPEYIAVEATSNSNKYSDLSKDILGESSLNSSRMNSTALTSTTYEEVENSATEVATNNQAIETANRTQETAIPYFDSSNNVTTVSNAYDQANSTLGSQIADVYAELFVYQKYPIKVHIDHLDDQTISQLISTFNIPQNTTNLAAIRSEVVEGVVSVELAAAISDIVYATLQAMRV